MIERAAVETEACLKIDLLMIGHAICRASVEYLRGPLMIIVADILDDRIGARAKFSSDRDGRFKGWISLRHTRIPEDREHPAD